ncbi:MAG: hypothetical protein V4722_00285 [Bacteroidota bacterium]
MKRTIFFRITMGLVVAATIGCGGSDTDKKAGDTLTPPIVDTALNRADSATSDTAVPFPEALIKPPKPGEEKQK